MKTLEAILNETDWTLAEIGLPNAGDDGGWVDIPVDDLSEIKGVVQFASDKLIVVLAESGARIEMYRLRDAEG